MITPGTLNCRTCRGVNQGFARDVRALVGVEDGGFLGRGAGGRGGRGREAVALPCEGSGLWTCMCDFAAVLETVCLLARAAVEGEEVQLAAVFVLAVAADGFEVFIGHFVVVGRFGAAAAFRYRYCGHFGSYIRSTDAVRCCADGRNGSGKW